MQTGDERIRQEIEGRLRVLPMRDFEVARLQALFGQAIRDKTGKTHLSFT